MTAIEQTIARLESLKPMLESMDNDADLERAVCKHNAKATVMDNGSISCEDDCPDCVFGLDVEKDGEGNVTNYGYLEEVINELKLIQMLED